MIPVDTSVWVDHLRASDAVLAERLSADQVMIHPFVIGELARGNLRQRDNIPALLHELPCSAVASEAEGLRCIDETALSGRGIRSVDIHLLASARLTGGMPWTRDKRLRTGAIQRALAADPAN